MSSLLASEWYCYGYSSGLKRGNHWFDSVTRCGKVLPPTALVCMEGPWPVYSRPGKMSCRPSHGQSSHSFDWYKKWLGMVKKHSLCITSIYGSYFYGTLLRVLVWGRFTCIMRQGTIKSALELLMIGVFFCFFCLISVIQLEDEDEEDLDPIVTPPPLPPPNNPDFRKRTKYKTGFSHDSQHK